MPAAALAVRRGDVRAGRERARRQTAAAARSCRRTAAASAAARPPTASYSGSPFVSRTREPSATAPSVCAVGTGGSTQSTRGGGGLSGRRTTANWLSARTSSAPLVGADEDAQAMVLGLVLDDARQLEAAEAGNGADRRLDPDPGQLVLEIELISVAPRCDQPS